MSNDSKTTEAAVEAAAQALWQVQPLTRENVRAAARRVLEAAAPRTITTVEELDALPHGAVVFNNNNESVSKYGDWWFFPGIKHRFAVAAVSLPVTVLREPEAEATR